MMDAGCLELGNGGNGTRILARIADEVERLALMKELRHFRRSRSSIPHV
jgi:hypothetical protein